MRPGSDASPVSDAVTDAVTGRRSLSTFLMDRNTEQATWREDDLARSHHRLRATSGLRDDSASTANRRSTVRGDGELQLTEEVGSGRAVDVDLDVPGAMAVRVEIRRVECLGQRHSSPSPGSSVAMPSA